MESEAIKILEEELKIRIRRAHIGGYSETSKERNREEIEQIQEALVILKQRINK